MKWFRSVPMFNNELKSRLEIWSLCESLSFCCKKQFQVSVDLGKSTNVLSLKREVLQNLKAEILSVRTSRQALYSATNTKKIEKCPVCEISALNSEFKFKIYDGNYCQCSNCGHCFVINRPTKQVLQKFYSSDSHYSSTYTDKLLMEERIKEIVVPKLEWVIKTYKNLYGKPPRKILDVGAGGGHFVYACKKNGLDAVGVEISESSRIFCKNNFGIDLECIDFTKEYKRFSDVDIITFWGVIEHVPNPIEFLKSAYKVLFKRESLVVAEVPRWNCLGTVVQEIFNDSVVRHLDPLGHINCFTDNSLLSAFYKSGFSPVAAWYFGMDVYELLVQMSYFLEDERIIYEMGEHINKLQNILDSAFLSDEIVLVGQPYI
ncbi:MAG: Methionine biosynthesis protein MetW-like protein [candidate division TM6 bacterium GW2011_GWE2_31_21]|nr:MAG: Methionine biosynthesis protein MetW-like protein [candidate division TM6 bacterium GW2011_GWE2_31_21]KKP53912.1 MAG: Methionine biosynthesis protein MetW-like protein [candidate division TM6 bacterium GW2011_GWF2_33_332]